MLKFLDQLLRSKQEEEEKYIAQKRRTKNYKKALGIECIRFWSNSSWNLCFACYIQMNILIWIYCSFLRKNCFKIYENCNIRSCKFIINWLNVELGIYPLSANPTIHRLLPTNCLSVFYYFVGLMLKALWLTGSIWLLLYIIWMVT